jgi:hypothetical protein
MEENRLNNSGMINIVPTAVITSERSCKSGSNNKPRIEELRQRLILLAVQKGFTDPDVLSISQELDEVINEYLEKIGFGAADR